MRDDKQDQFVDELLEASLKQYRGEEPRPGLETRILAGIRGQERAARRRGLAWTVAACAGMLAAVILALHFTRAPIRQSAPSASLTSPATTPPVSPELTLQPPLLAARRSALRVRKVAPRRLRPEQFPSPLPLTQQEKLLLAYLDIATQPDLVAGTNKTDETTVTELEISSIQIVPLEIKPLDDSQSELEK